MMVQPTTTRAVTIPGPTGQLEALVDAPPQADGSRVAVVCHPHPLYGGSMTNKVAHMLAKAFNDAGAIAVRFNYRGVGASAGQYDEGNGEAADALAVLEWTQRDWPKAQRWLGGFSFGGAVAIRAAGEREVARLVTVAPAVDRVAAPATKLPRCPWLVVQGDRDDVVDPQHVARWVEGLPVRPEIAVIAGGEHFFHGKLTELRRVVLEWLARHENPT
jgi:uncharacterized protein